ncbi:unnamed protein product [Urochloa decumbens]|uniref:Uncharacterized protein n=1 Tax=Urochloa decumbens TaxID=240449 RepID=A0ABC9DAQ5_9POAL
MSSRTRLSSVLTATASSTAPSPLPPRSALLDALAAAADRARAGTLRPADAHQLFDELLRQRTRVPERMLNGFLAALAKSMPSSACSDGPALAVALFKRMSQHSAGPRVLPATVHTYNILIDCCCHARRPDLAPAFFGRLLRTGLGIDVITFNSLLKGLCDAKRTNEALDMLLYRMPEVGCVPNVICYNVLLKGFCNEKRNDGIVPNCRIFNILIHAYATCGMMGDAMLIFQGMKQQGVKTNAVTYSTIIAAFCRMGRLDDAMGIFNQMIDQGVPPEKVVYQCLIQGLCNHGGLEKVKELVSEMISKGMHLDVVFFNSVINSLCKEGKVLKAQLVFDLIRHIGLCPDVATFCSLMDGYCLTGKMKEASGIFDSMVSAGLEPSVVAYNTLISGYCRCGRIDNGLNNFREMLLKGVKPSTITYSIVIDGLFQAGITVGAKEKFNKMIESGIPVDIKTYSIVLKGLFRNNCFDEAIALFKKLCSTDMKIDIITVNTMISGMFKARRVEEAKHTSIPAYGLIPSVVTYNLMMTNLINEGLLEEADDIFSAMENTGCAPDSRLLNHVARVLLEKGEIIRAGNYLAKMDEKNFSLEASTTEMLISLFSREGTCLEHIKLLPEKYQFLMGANDI